MSLDNLEPLDAFSLHPFQYFSSCCYTFFSFFVSFFFLLSLLQASYFNQIPEHLRKQHLKAVLAIRDLKQHNLSLKLESKGDEGSVEITFINSQTETGMLHSQIKSLAVPPGCHLSRVRVFSSLDNALALNVFSFTSNIQTKQVASRADAAHILEYIKEIKEGELHLILWRFLFTCGAIILHVLVISQ